MSQQLVITALGADRPGIVDELSKTLFRQKLNIEDSRMSVLGGEFAILLLVSGDIPDIDAFVKEQPSIEQSLAMKLLVKPTTKQAAGQPSKSYDIDVEAIDNPGIVHRLASFFSSRQINIVELETDHYQAPHTGTTMFSLHMTVNIPDEMPIQQLREAFMASCDELNLDARFSQQS